MLTSSRGIRVGVILINYPLYMLKEYLVFKNVASLQFSQLALISFLLNAPMVSAFIIEDYCGKKGKISSIDSVFRLSTLILLCSVSYQFLNIPAAVKTKFQIVYFIWLLLFPLLNILSYKIEYASVKNLLELSYLFAVTCFFYYGFPVFSSFNLATSNTFKAHLLALLICFGAIIGLFLIVTAIYALFLYTRYYLSGWAQNSNHALDQVSHQLSEIRSLLDGIYPLNGPEGERELPPLVPYSPHAFERRESMVDGEESDLERELPPLVPYSYFTAGRSAVEGEEPDLEGASVSGFNPA